MVKKSQHKKNASLTLHGLLGALSYWGTATRMFLFSILAVTVLLVALSEAQTSQMVDAEVMVFIYALGSFLLLDFGYVLIARGYQLRRSLDMLVLVLADLMLGMLYIAPNIVVDSRLSVKVDPLMYLVFIPIVVLAGRMLIGMLFGRRAV